MKAIVPNFFTLLNLFLGVLGIWIASEMTTQQVKSGNLYYVSVLIFAAAVCDFFDGFFAKLLKCQSAIGKELDALADLVSFGVLPSFILSKLLQSSKSELWVLLILPLLMPCFVAYRLARFNATALDEDYFIGLSSTASGLFVAILPIVYRYTEYFWLKEIIIRGDAVVYTTIILSILMVCKIKFMSFKFSSWHWRLNKIRYITLISFFLALLFFKVEGILLTFAIYLLSAAFINIRF